MDSELAQALMLVRVSTMKMLRLQLAIERRDRAVAMQAVDDLIELDAWMALAASRAPDSDLMDAMAREVDDQRGALLQEKFGLAAGLVKREPGPRPWAEPQPATPSIIAPGRVQASGSAAREDELDFLGPVEVLLLEEEPRQRRRRGWLIAVAIVPLLIAAGVGAALWLGWRPDDLLAQLLSQGGSLWQTLIA